MLEHLPDSFKIAALGVVSVLSYGSAALSALYPQGIPEYEEAPAVMTKIVHQPLNADTFRQNIDTYSKNNLLVVVLRRQECPSCAGVMNALEEARYGLMKKVHVGFAIYELNAEQNPEAAALLQQSDPAAQARLHVFYNGEKIHESKGISTDPYMVLDYMEMAHALAIGEVSILDRYEPPATAPVVPHP